MSRGLSSLLLTIALAGCGPKASTPDTVPPGASPDAPVAAADALTGPVLEQLPASPYVYLRIKTARGDVWAAVPETKVENGAVVTIASPMLMTNFESASLKRTFDQVYFGELAAEGATMSAAGANPHAGVPAVAAPVEVGNVEKATGADARRVSEIW
jgi:hypothetical protein